MASGDYVASISPGKPTATLYARLDIVTGGSDPNELVEVYDFDSVAAEYLDFACVLLANYDGGGITVSFNWSASSSTSNAVSWRVAIRRINDDAEDINDIHAYQYWGVDVAPPTVIGEVAYETIDLTDGAWMDNLGAGEKFILRFKRHATGVDDTMSGDAELHVDDVLIRET